MNELPGIENLNIPIDRIEDDVTEGKNVRLSILRLDNIHPVVSGNKLFKLHYFLESAIGAQKPVITFGGAYSNHLAATAFSCKQYGLRSVGIVRGEKPANLSHTLLFCLEQGMHLEFVSREQFAKPPDEMIEIFGLKHTDCVVIPEGGFSDQGTRGAELIAHHFANKNFSHICCPVGTGTTIAGLIRTAKPGQQVIGFSALKQLEDFEARLRYLKAEKTTHRFISDYHFGGYAKRTAELISFMNDFYDSHSIPLDFVYTGKMMFGVHDLLKTNFFPQHSKILCIHTGGLQGNLSLPEGMLKF